MAERLPEAMLETELVVAPCQRDLELAALCFPASGCHGADRFSHSKASAPTRRATRSAIDSTTGLMMPLPLDGRSGTFAQARVLQVTTESR